MANEEQGSVGQHLDDRLTQMHDEISVLKQALRTEQARSDLLWDLAVQRGWVSEEDARVARVQAA